MAELLICRAPGDELAQFGGMLLSRSPGTVDVVAVAAHPFRAAHGEGEVVLRAACEAAGARSARLLHFAHLTRDPLDLCAITDELGAVDGYERIYTHSVQDARPLCARIVAAVARVAREVWTTAGGGRVDEIVRTTQSQFQKRLELLSHHYPDLLSEEWFNARELRDTDLFQRHAGANLYRYFRGCLDWHVGDFNYRHPWELEASPYEKRRYAAELDALHQIPWQTLIEVGACEGAFTQQVRAQFPERHIVAFEPDPYFFESLQRRMEGCVELHRGDAEAAGEMLCDVLFMSSAIYYLWRMPYRMLRNARYVIVSHARRYHREQLDNVLLAQGFETIYRSEVPACVEPMEGITEIKYGTEIKIWKRR